MTKKKITFELKQNFNDIFMRELGLDISDDNRIYDMDSETMFQYNEKFIRYFEDENDILRGDEIEFNMLENSRLAQMLVGIYLDKVSTIRGLEIISHVSSTSVRGEKGYAAFLYIEKGQTQECRSEIFLNESVRLFNLVCKLNHTDHLYDFNEFDIIDLTR